MHELRTLPPVGRNEFDPQRQDHISLERTCGTPDAYVVLMINDEIDAENKK